MAFTKHGTETPLAHSLFPEMKVDFKKQTVRTFENFMSPRDSPRLIFCVLWRNYAYRTQDTRLKKSLTQVLYTSAKPGKLTLHTYKGYLHVKWMVKVIGERLILL